MMRTNEILIHVWIVGGVVVESGIASLLCLWMALWLTLRMVRDHNRHVAIEIKGNRIIGDSGHGISIE